MLAGLYSCMLTTAVFVCVSADWPQRTVYAMARGSAIWTGDEVTWDLVISRLEELYNCFLRLKKEGYEWQGTFNDGCYFLKRRLVP